MKLRRSRTVDPLELSFGSWDDLPAGEDVVILCHPEWRGVRSAAMNARSPMVESARPDLHADEITRHLVDRGVRWLVIHGFPPGSDALLTRAKAAGLATACILHSSPTQHGGEPWEAAVVDHVLRLSLDGVVDRVGMVKAGVAQFFSEMGFPVIHLPNRAPTPIDTRSLDLGEGFHVGVFAEPIFRKNLVPQILAGASLPAGLVHVIRRPEVDYLDSLPIREHGLIDPDSFRRLLGSVDLNLYVTLSECHPLTPVESYLAGVPCLISPTSELFLDEPQLAELTVVTELDNPQAILEGARRLIAHRDEAVERARAWIDDMDVRAEQAWLRLISGSAGGQPGAFILDES